jgi:NADPH:quinone reductase-like Zn-dependent oxidoreductase
MKQVWIPKFGAPSVLEVREAPDPEPKAGEVRVAVQAAGVNFADVVARQGMYMDAPPVPFVVGYECSGVVDKLGPGVSEPKVGTRVLAMTRFGGYSSKVCLPARQAAVMPDGLTFEQGAAIPVNFLTAWHALVVLGNIRKGDRVLLHAAAGGVGLTALQICKLKGAGQVLGTASPGKHDRLKQMGLDAAIDYRSLDFEEEVKKHTGGKGVNIVLDAVGGESFEKSYRSLCAGGKLVCFGASQMTGEGTRSLWRAFKMWWALPAFKPIDLMMTNRGVFGVNMLHLADNQQDLVFEELTEIVRLVGEKKLAPVIDLVVPFDQAPKAHQQLEGRGNFGKVVLDFSKA